MRESEHELELKIVLNLERENGCEFNLRELINDVRLTGAE